MTSFFGDYMSNFGVPIFSPFGFMHLSAENFQNFRETLSGATPLVTELCSMGREAGIDAARSFGARMLLWKTYLASQIYSGLDGAGAIGALSSTRGAAGSALQAAAEGGDAKAIELDAAEAGRAATSNAPAAETAAEEAEGEEQAAEPPPTVTTERL